MRTRPHRAAAHRAAAHRAASPRKNPTDKRLDFVWPSLNNRQKLFLLRVVFEALGIDDWSNRWAEFRAEAVDQDGHTVLCSSVIHGADLMLECFKPSLKENTVIDPYIPWLAKVIKKTEKEIVDRTRHPAFASATSAPRVIESILSSELVSLRRSFRAICVWASENRIDLNKVDVEQALAEARKYVTRAARKELAESEERNTVFTFPDGYKVVKLQTEKALKYEGDVMKHCVGTYWKQVRAGAAVIYSFRSPEPHEGGHTSLVTLEYNPEDEYFVQIMGPQNDEPEDQWKPYMLAIVEKLAPRDYKNKLDMGKPPRDVVIEAHRHFRALGGDFIGWVLSSADLSNLDLTGATFVNCTLKEVNFTNTILNYAAFTDSVLTGANMAGAKLNGATFLRSHLMRADLEGAELEKAEFTHCDLSEANLANSSIVGTRFLGSQDEGVRPRLRREERVGELAWGFVPPNFRGAKYGVTKHGAVIWAEYEEYREVEIYTARILPTSEPRVQPVKSYREGGPTPADLSEKGITVWPYGFDPAKAGARAVRSDYSVGPRGVMLARYEAPPEEDS